MSFFTRKTVQKLTAQPISLLVGTGLLFIVSGLGIVISQVLINQPQDIRREAMVPSGRAELTFSPEPGTLIPSSSDRKITITLQPNQVQFTTVKLQFDIITNDVIEQITPVALLDNGLQLIDLKQHKVDHGYTISYEARREYSEVQERFRPLPLIYIQFAAKKDGQLSISFNPEKTVLIDGATSQDELKLINTVFYTVAKDPLLPDTAERKDDLYFDPFTNETTKFTFYTTDTNTEVTPSQMIAGRSYRVKYLAFVQNWVKNTASVPESSITVQLRVNNGPQIQGKLSYKSLASKVGGDTTLIEGTFTAQEVNTFVATVDPSNVVAEQAEDNNSWQREIRISTTTTSTGVSIKQCNEVCSSNSECPTDQRCYDTGTDKRCRLVVNVTSTSCSALPNQGLNRSCNQYCADSRECATGYTCWYNRCRLPNNVTSTSCVRPTTTSDTQTTKGGAGTTAATYQSCDADCRTNRDCQAGLRCYQGSCRHPLNPKNISCDPDQVASTATSSAQASPRPTASPSGTATTPQPTSSISATQPPATPIPLPPAGPDESVLDSALLVLNQYLTSLSAMPQVLGIPLPILIIGAGILFIIIAALLFSASRRKPKIEQRIQPSVSLQSADTKARTATTTTTTAPTLTPLRSQGMQSPSVQPVPQQPTQPPQLSADKLSMSERLRQRGVLPEQKL